MELILYTLRSLSCVVVEPSMIILLVFLGILFYLKNRKVAAMQKMIIGEELTSPLELTLSQIVLGIFAGIVGSIIFTVLGISFTETSGIQFLFLLSIILMMIKPRFVCFSYSGAILGAVGIITTYVLKILGSNKVLFDIDIMSLMTFVGVMHIIEAILVMFDGDRGSIPVFTKKNNKIMGGYALNRYWILPVAIFLAISVSTNSDIASNSIATPNWWPLLKSEYLTTLLASAVLSSMPFFGVIGYSSVTFTKRKEEKKVSSGLYILAFGIAITLLSQLCRLGVIAEIIVIIAAPAGHEFMLYIQRKKEEKREEIFISDEEGICILEIVPYCELYDLGIRPGDKIIAANGVKVNSETEIYEKAKSKIERLSLEVLLKSGEIKSVELKENSKRGLRALLVPKAVNKDRIVPVEKEDFSNILNDMKNKTE